MTFERFFQLAELLSDDRDTQQEVREFLKSIVYRDQQTVAEDDETGGTFLGLDDTPDLYTGSSGLFAQVNPSETALRFAPVVSGGQIEPVGIRLDWYGSWAFAANASYSPIYDTVTWEYPASGAWNYSLQPSGSALPAFTSALGDVTINANDWPGLYVHTGRMLFQCDANPSNPADEALDQWAVNTWWASEGPVGPHYAEQGIQLFATAGDPTQIAISAASVSEVSSTSSWTFWGKFDTFNWPQTPASVWLLREISLNISRIVPIEVP